MARRGKAPRRLHVLLLTWILLHAAAAIAAPYGVGADCRVANGIYRVSPPTGGAGAARCRRRSSCMAGADRPPAKWRMRSWFSPLRGQAILLMLPQGQGGTWTVPGGGRFGAVHRTHIWDRCASGRELRLVLHPGGHEMPAGWFALALPWVRRVTAIAR